MKLFFQMKLVDERGCVHAAIEREVPAEAAYMGERAADEMRLGSISGATFDHAVRTLKMRRVRRGLLRKVAANAGEALADHLEDREGWHGLDRQNATERRLKGGAR